MKEQINQLVNKIQPFDLIEIEHKRDVLDWFGSTDDIYRREKPKTPPKHLVSYCLFLDQDEGKLLLTEHKKSGLLLPTGGHVDPDEHPTDTAKREIEEELSITPGLVFEDPIFVTVTQTVGTPERIHTDVSLWYVFAYDSNQPLEYDEREFSAVHWFTFDEVLAKDTAELDYNMHRFVRKLKQVVL